jgi:hypothetical protein
MFASSAKTLLVHATNILKFVPVHSSDCQNQNIHYFSTVYFMKKLWKELLTGQSFHLQKHVSHLLSFHVTFNIIPHD